MAGVVGLCDPVGPSALLTSVFLTMGFCAWLTGAEPTASVIVCFFYPVGEIS